jgi:hypothetical protein
MNETKVMSIAKARVIPEDNGTGPAIQKWEYDYVFYTHPSGLSVEHRFKEGDVPALDIINQKAGKSGWELQSVTPLTTEGFTTSLLFTLKRPLKE